uniref:Uncharacterized protein n=1 Tax=Anguilla anguilla TaxID=7936 RepID=A0A0E9TIB3_ANGAN
MTLSFLSGVSCGPCIVLESHVMLSIICLSTSACCQKLNKKALCRAKEAG